MVWFVVRNVKLVWIFVALNPAKSTGDCIIMQTLPSKWKHPEKEDFFSIFA